MGVLSCCYKLLDRLWAYKVRPAEDVTPHKFETGTESLSDNSLLTVGGSSGIGWLAKQKLFVNRHGEPRGAGGHDDQALKIARGITTRPALIEALLARGRWASTRAHQDLTGFGNLSGLLDQAFADLDEALGYALEGGYRVYEADLRVALAWAGLAAGDPARARAEAERAHQMSADMGYHWGQLDAAEVLAVV